MQDINRYEGEGSNSFCSVPSLAVRVSIGLYDWAFGKAVRSRMVGLGISTFGLF